VLGRTTRAVVVTILVFPLVLLTACSRPSSSGAAPVAITMTDCGGSPQVRPAVLEVICATNSITARSLAWSAWGKPVATAEGTAVVDLCAYEDCHTGTYNSFPIVMIASGVVSCAKSAHAYSRLQYVFVGRSPFQGLPAHMNFANFDVGTSRPSPGNQTTSLSC
jgi:hypothetical protein